MGGVHEPYAELFLQSMYLYELLSSSPNSAQDGPVSCSAPNISVSVVAVRTTGFSYLSVFLPWETQQGSWLNLAGKIGQ